MKSVKIGEMTLEVPIIQGGMGVGISLGNLAGNVALNGGMGCYFYSSTWISSCGF